MEDAGETDGNEDFDDFLNEYPAISIEEHPPFYEHVRRGNALISRYLAIPFPELLDDDTWCEKFRQVEWLLEAGHLPVRKKERK